MALVGALITIGGLYSCEKTDINPASPSTVIMEQPMLVLAPGMWRITSFQWHDREDNNHFISYTFQLNVEGSITAVHNNIVEHGKWSKKNDILEIDFVSDPLTELNCNWKIISHSVNSIDLKGLSPYDNSSEYLSVEKISTSVLVK